MPASHDSGGDRPGPTASDPTAVDAASPFDSTEGGADAAPPAARQTQLSDPPTGLVVPRDNFRELLPGTVVGENYEVDARLGAGAMGEVYAARHVRLGKRVAIKVIGRRLSDDEAAIERFAMEARTLAQIQHPAIVAVEHVGELADGRTYFVMEFLRGESLFERLQRGRLPLPEALRVLDQMARGLDAAHAEGVVHRDLKPENTFLVHLPGEPPAVKLLDFGLMKLVAERVGDDRRAERTQSGVAIGTPMYMSPEQARGPDVDHRTDVYALGCVAYELVLGTPPFPHARTVPELYAAHLNGSPPLPRSIWPEIPPQLDFALFAMLAKDPGHRPTLAQFRAVIAAVRSSSSQRAVTEFVRPRAPRPRRTKIVVIIATALVGGITIGGRLMSKSPSPPASPAPKAHRISAPTAPMPTPDAGAPPVPETPHLATPKKRTLPRQSTKRGNDAGRAVSVVPASTAAAIDAGVPEAPDPVRKRTPPTIDRNQTINPFKRKTNP